MDSTAAERTINHEQYPKLVFTIREKCRVCFTCVRECPAKAIRIASGQAEVITERCIACGNCIKVCSQGAKVFRKETEPVEQLLASGKEVIAMVAPSFPAEFTELANHEVLVGMIRKLGFTKVVEVSFGADLVARKYKEKMGQNAISSDCPAIVSYIERYFPDLTKHLASVVSPMVAMSRVVKQVHGNEVKTVFIGPCLAKKAESSEVDQVITFRELRELFQLRKIIPARVTPGPFDPPLGGRGAIFPLSHGLLSTMEVDTDILSENVIVAGGSLNFQDALREYEQGNLVDNHLHLLCCEGCILGPGMSPYPNLGASSMRYTKKSKIISYANQKMSTLDRQQWRADLETYEQIDLSRGFRVRDMRRIRPSEQQITDVLYRMGKFGPADHLNCGACGYDSCEEHAIAIINGLAETEMCLPYTIEKLHRYIGELNISKEKLASVQEALSHSEKLAGMGQLSAGIAHELNNPLGVITMYSNILKEELPPEHPMNKDLDLIVEQADRCRKIVGGLLNFARKNQVNLQETDVLKLAGRSISSVVFPESIRIELVDMIRQPLFLLDYDQMAQVITNLIKNSVEAMTGEGKITVELSDSPEQLMIRICDTGHGIREEDMDKLFTPFFTTKGPGKGTGLGLPIIYGIVKMHKGQIDVKSNADPGKGETGTQFTITVPRQSVNQLL